jgi:hypothetical protein
MTFDDMNYETDFQTSGGDVKLPVQFNINREHGDIFADFVCVEIGGLTINSVDAVKAFGSEQVSRAEDQRLKIASNVCFWNGSLSYGTKSSSQLNSPTIPPMMRALILDGN